MSEPLCAQPSSHAPRSPEGFDLQGHRGARGLAPENTIPAFRRALELGVTTLEMDVVIAGDGTVVVSHEPWMRREICRTPDGGRIGRGQSRQHNLFQMNYQEVAAYDCGSLQLPDFPEQQPEPASKPRLRDVIALAEAFGRQAPVFYNIEVKSRSSWDERFHPPPDRFVQGVLTVVANADVSKRTTIQSFDPRALEAVHRQNEPVRTALLVSRSGNEGLMDNLSVLSFATNIYSPDHRLVDDDLVQDVHELEMTLVPWTVNTRDEMRRLLNLGVDGFITDYPDRAQVVFGERPQ